MLTWSLAFATAWAHGPAPAALEVLAWADDSVCAGVPAEATPSLVRTNIGLVHRDADGAWIYQCPARWGDAEQALAAADPTGDVVIVAAGAGLWRATDGGCQAEALDLPEGEVPVDVLWHDDGFLLATRRFDTEAASTLWSVDAQGVRQVARWTDRRVDGLLSTPDGLWLAGAGDTPRVWALEGEEHPLAFGELLPSSLTPRWATDDEVFVVGAIAASWSLWSVDRDDGRAALLTEGATSIHGPIAVEGALVAVVSGQVREGPLFDEGLDAVPWTCLGVVHGRPFACSLPAMFALSDDGEGLDATEVFEVDLLSPPDPACDPVGSACELDWVHFGGESGYVDTVPGTCPGDPRTAPDDPDDPTVPEDCGCGGDDPDGALALALPVWWWRRRRSGRG